LVERVRGENGKEKKGSQPSKTNCRQESGDSERRGLMDWGIAGNAKGSLGGGVLGIKASRKSLEKKKKENSKKRDKEKRGRGRGRGKRSH